MTVDELAEATREFDKPLPTARLRPGTKADRDRLKRALRAGEKVRLLLSSFKLDPSLLEQATTYATRKNITLSQVLERGLRRELAVQD